jgi:hypothetical protein
MSGRTNSKQIIFLISSKHNSKVLSFTFMLPSVFSTSEFPIWYFVVVFLGHKEYWNLRGTFCFLKRTSVSSTVMPECTDPSLPLMVHKLGQCSWATRLWAGQSRIWITVRVMVLPLRQTIQMGSGDHPVSYSAGIGSSLPRDKVAGAWGWPLMSISCWD